MPESDEICTECAYSVLNMDGDMFWMQLSQVLLLDKWYICWKYDSLFC